MSPDRNEKKWQKQGYSIALLRLQACGCSMKEKPFLDRSHTD
jgi:hypothetical protein